MLWMFSVGFGLIPTVLTSLVWLFILKRESFKFIVQKGDPNNEAIDFLKQIYNLEHPEQYSQLLDEEKKLVKHDDVEAGDVSPNTRRIKETEAVSWGKVMCDPYYRTCTWVICLLAFLNQVTGTNSINIYSQTIFENLQKESSGGGISPRAGNTMIMASQVAAGFFTPFMGRCLGIKTIFVGGMFGMGLFLFLIGLFAKYGKNNILVVCMMLDLFIYQITLGTYTWVYIGQVAQERSASLAVFTIWFFVFVLALTTNSIFAGLGNAGTFWLFSGMTIVGGILILITHKETKGLTDAEIKVLFVPENLKQNDD